MNELSTSVLIPSFQRPDKLNNCLQSLASQTLLPDEVIVVWQADDVKTRDSVEQLQPMLNYPLKLVHSLEAGIVQAENAALEVAQGEIILLCDDDVITPPGWIARRVSFYSDPTIGAVGSSANNHYPDGSSFPKRKVEPIGKLTWYGKAHGNMYDQIEEWSSRSPIDVDHLVGYNFSIRRSGFDRFEKCLKPYWQKFELDACLQVKNRGYRVIFDFANVVNHYPTNTVYVAGREGDLQVKIFNAGYNNSFILAKHSPRHLQFPRLIFLLLVGSVGESGIIASLVAIKRYGYPLREFQILVQSCRHKIAGWKNGMKSRAKTFI